MRVAVAVVVDGDASKLAIVEASNPIVIEWFALVRSSLDSEILKNFGLCCPLLLPLSSRDLSQKVDSDFLNVLPPMALSAKGKK